jgi:hypothetical protein
MHNQAQFTEILHLYFTSVDGTLNPRNALYDERQNRAIPSASQHDGGTESDA